MNALIIGIVILIFGIISIINKEKHTKLNKGIQNYKCVPQPVILKNGQMILAQINMSYNITDKKKAKKALKNGINIFRKLEYEGITTLRKLVDNVKSIENINGKLEIDLKNKLSEIGQDLGVQVIELHIKFGDKSDFNIRNYSYNKSIEDIRDNNYEETNTKYNFAVIMKTSLGGRRSTLRKTIFITKIDTENDMLKYKLSRKFENSDKWLKNLERKYNSFAEGTREIYMNNILSIKYKIGFTFALYFYDFMSVIGAILTIISLVMGQLNFGNLISTGLEKIPINFNYIPSVIFLLFLLVIIVDFTCKCIEIKYRTDEGIKKIIFPISRIFFFSVPNSIKGQVNSLLEEIRQINQEVKIKKDRLKLILISCIIISLIIYVSIPIFFKLRYIQDNGSLYKNELSYNKDNDLVYCNIAFDKGKVVDIINKKSINGNIVSEYEFELTDGEMIKIEGYNIEYGKVYNICVENYYKKDTNKLFKTNYLIRDNSNVIKVFVNNAEYVYDYIGDKTFKFNSLNNDNIIDYETKIYYREIGNVNTLYNFINYDKNILSITDDFDVKEFKRNNYENIEKIDKYISEYGTCYILKANYNEKIDYLMYIENKHKTTLNELDGILLNSRINRTDSFENKEEAIKAFKRICPEK